nr:hypothetical protein L204_01746 [Cryptococcus depauperatus CBS 7855]
MCEHPREERRRTCEAPSDGTVTRHPSVFLRSSVCRGWTICHPPKVHADHGYPRKHAALPGIHQAIVGTTLLSVGRRKDQDTRHQGCGCGQRLKGPRESLHSLGLCSVAYNKEVWVSSGWVVVLCVGEGTGPAASRHCIRSVRRQLCLEAGSVQDNQRQWRLALALGKRRMSSRVIEELGKRHIG